MLSQENGQLPLCIIESRYCPVYTVRHMREKEKDETWIRSAIGQTMKETVYITPNHYDGGYEVRVGSLDFFVDYESIDANDTAHIQTFLSRL